MNELRQTKIEMLEYAAKNVHKHTGICYALEEFKGGNFDKKTIEFKAWDELTDYILNAISPYCFFSTWLHDNSEEVYQDRNYITSCRIAWINWMIQCLKEDQAREDAE